MDVKHCIFKDSNNFYRVIKFLYSLDFSVSDDDTLCLSRVNELQI